MKVLDVAKICHEANKALCETQGDLTQVAWEDAPEWQQQSAYKGVIFNLQNPDAPASASHDSWLAEKEADGWKYGAEKNAELKEHPCFVPYDELPDSQRVKDHIFKAIVGACGPFVDAALPSAEAQTV
jgi:hypothetical protein